MILFDTSVWVAHFAAKSFDLGPFLSAQRVLMHDFVVGELSMGSLSNRATTIRDLQRLPPVTSVQNEEVLVLIESRRLYARGIGLIDAHLLASVLVTPGAELRTLDRRLAGLAQDLGVGGLASDVPS
jgi:hypothetical protein